MDYTQRIKDLMKQKVSQTFWEFARTVEIPGPTLDGLLNRTARTSGPRIDTIEKICKGLGITVGEFMGEKDTLEESIFSRHKLSEDQIKFLYKTCMIQDLLKQ